MPEVKRASEKVMDTPLPKILDEIEDAIKEAKEAAKESREAAKVAHEAAVVAKKAGEAAGLEARKAAEEAVSGVGIKVDEIAARLMSQIEDVRQVAMEGLKLGQALRTASVRTINAGADEFNKV